MKMCDETAAAATTTRRKNLSAENKKERK